MSQKISRRAFATRSVAAAAGLVGTPLLMAQDKPVEKPPVTDAELEDVQSQLAKPLSDEAKRILRSNLSDQKSNRKKRMAVKLPDITEPCFTYIPTPKREQGREEL